MRISYNFLVAGSGVVVSWLAAYAQDVVQTMLPWLLAVTMVVLCDLAVGIRKSVKLDVDISGSRAARETMGKMVIYWAFVLMVAMVDAASDHTLKIAKWGCLFVCAVEGGSIISNILKPHGIDISLGAIIKAFSKKATGLDEEEAEALISGDKDAEKTLAAIKDREQRAADEYKKKHRKKGTDDNDKKK